MISGTLNIMNYFIYLRDCVYLCVTGKNAPYVLPYIVFGATLGASGRIVFLATLHLSSLSNEL